jgi:hypothetical protein
VRLLVDDYTYERNRLSQMADHHPMVNESKSALFAKISAHKDRAVAAACEMLYGEPNSFGTLNNLLALVDRLDPAYTSRVLIHLLAMHDHFEPMAAADYASKHGGMPELLEPMLKAAAVQKLPFEYRLLRCIPGATGAVGLRRLTEFLQQREEPLAPLAITMYGDEAVGPLDEAIRTRKDSYRLKCLDALSTIKSLKAAKAVLARTIDDIRSADTANRIYKPIFGVRPPTAKPSGPVVAPSAESAYLARALISARSPALPEMRALARDRHPLASEAGVCALIQLKDPRTVDDLLAVSPSSRLYTQAVSLAASLAPLRVISKGSRLLWSSDGSRRRAGMSLLCNYTPDLKRRGLLRAYRQVVIEAAQSRDPAVRGCAYCWLQNSECPHEDDAAEALKVRMRSLVDPDPDARGTAIACCADIADKRIIARLKAIAHNPKEPKEIRDIARRALKN